MTFDFQGLSRRSIISTSRNVGSRTKCKFLGSLPRRSCRFVKGVCVCIYIYIYLFIYCEINADSVRTSAFQLLSLSIHS